MKSSAENSKIPFREVLSIVKPDVDLKQFLFVLWRRKWWLVIPVIVMVSASVLYALKNIRPIYEASAMLKVAPGRLLNSSMREITPGASINTAENDALVRKLRSSEFLLKLAERLDLATRDEQLTAAAKSLQARAPWTSYEDALKSLILKTLLEKVQVGKLAGEQGLFRIFARDTSPKLAYDIVKNLADIFIENSRTGAQQSLQALKEESDAQIQIYKEKITESEQKLREYQEHLAAKRAKSVVIDSQDIIELRKRKNALEVAIADKEKRLEEILNRLPRNPGIGLINNEELSEISNNIKNKLRYLENKANIDSWDSKEDLIFNQEINSLRQQGRNFLDQALSELSPALNENVKTDIIEYHLITQIDMYVLRTKAKIVAGMLSGHLRDVVTEPTERLKLQNLEDELEQNRRIYSLFFNQSRGTLIEESLQSRDAEFKYAVVEPPQMPIYAIDGSKRRFVILAFLVSIAVGGALAYGREYLDQTIRDVKDVEQYLEHEVWGIVPKLSMPFTEWYKSLRRTDKDSTNGKHTGKADFADPISGQALSASRENYVETPELNEFKRLFNRLHTENQKRGTKVFMITSATLGEGKSTIAAYLAVTSALYQSTETILVDSDLRRPSIHRLYELPVQQGFADMLANQLDLDAATKPSSLPNLKVITAGKPELPPAELFSVSHLQSLVEELRRKFSIVIFDTPPIIPVSDTLLLSNFVDGILLVVKAGKSQKRVTQRAIDMLQTNSGKILGVVVNNLQSALPYYYDYRYYGYKYYR